MYYFWNFSLQQTLSETDLPISWMGVPACRYSENWVREVDGLIIQTFALEPLFSVLCHIFHPLFYPWYASSSTCKTKIPVSWESGGGVVRNSNCFSHRLSTNLPVFSILFLHFWSYSRVLHYKSSFFLVSPPSRHFQFLWPSKLITLPTFWFQHSIDLSAADTSSPSYYHFNGITAEHRG